MRCEGADNPPCRRCRNTGLECLFEKPSREATLTGEAGLESVSLFLLVCGLSLPFSCTDASAVWRIMLLKLEELKRLSQINCQNSCITYVLGCSIRIDLLQLRLLRSQSRPVIPNHQLYPYKMSSHSTHLRRVLPHLLLQCIACLHPNKEILFQTPDIKEPRPIIPLGRMIILLPCTATFPAVQVITYMAPHLMGPACLRFPVSSLWLRL